MPISMFQLLTGGEQIFSACEEETKQNFFLGLQPHSYSKSLFSLLLADVGIVQPLWGLLLSFSDAAVS